MGQSIDERLVKRGRRWGAGKKRSWRSSLEGSDGADPDESALVAVGTGLPGQRVNGRRGLGGVGLR